MDKDFENYLKVFNKFIDDLEKTKDNKLIHTAQILHDYLKLELLEKKIIL